jgi:TRAP transporter 4TM/12TM fusion protein
MTGADKLSRRPHHLLDGLYYAGAIAFSLYLFLYYWTSSGGPTLLAMAMVPAAFALYVLNALRRNDFYPRLPLIANYVIAAAYIAASAAVAVYMHTQYYDLGTVRAGMWNDADLLIGALMTVLILEYARQRHVSLLVLNIILILYAVYGWMVPGMFYHAGLSWDRIASAMSVEMSTGIFARLPQLALTVIGPFLLVLSALRAFGCIDSILRVTKLIAIRSPHALPQSAVIGSMCVGTVSGSGVANAITIGSATIPAMIGAGMPPATAAAIESVSSIGGQLMPPVMGIAAFLMAEFLGRSYFDVVARGYAPAIVYYASIAVSVYLLSSRHRTRLLAVVAETVGPRDWINMGAFAAVVGGLVGLMATLHLAPIFSALYVFVAVGGMLLIVHLASLLWSRQWFGRAILAPLLRFVDIFAEMTVDLTLLLTTLSILTAALVITGVPTKLGTLLIAAAGVNLPAMVILGFVFGALLGCGLPPAPTYILTALVIAPPFIRAGVNPWVVHFFAFFLAVWGELTPPTALVAAVAAKIANASFLQTAFQAVRLCIAIFTLMAGIFVRPALVTEPGLGQVTAMLLIFIATAGLAFTLQARFSDRPVVDLLIRIILAAFALVVLLHPSEEVAALACVPVGGFIGYWVLWRRAPAATQAPDGARIPRARAAKPYNS